MWFVIGSMDINLELGQRIKALRLSLREGQDVFGERFGVTQAAVSRWESGRIPKRTLWEKIAEVADVPVARFFFEVHDAMNGEGGLTDDAYDVRLVPVRGMIAAGVWLEDDETAQEANFSPVPSVLNRYKHTEQFAFRIVGPSMDKARISDGDFVICVDYWTVRARPESSDIVVVERRTAHLVERTCKQVVVTKGGIELWPRSNDPRFQTPIVLPSTKGPHPEDGVEIEIIALVIGQFIPR